MRDLVDTTEMYLRTIYELEEEGITPLRARIAERLEQSGPTVSQTVARMERDGLVKVASDRSLHMTDEGRTLAIAVMRKHRLAERLLTDVIGLDIDKVHAEACRWEHVMSEEVERRLVQVLDDIHHSPFGNPIPGLDEILAEQDGGKTDPIGVRAVDLPEDQDVQAKVLQVNEILQVDEDLFQELANAGIRPGVVIEVRNSGGSATLRHNGTAVELPEDVAHAIRLERV